MSSFTQNSAIYLEMNGEIFRKYQISERDLSELIKSLPQYLSFLENDGFDSSNLFCI